MKVDAQELFEKNLSSGISLLLGAGFSVEAYNRQSETLKLGFQLKELLVDRFGLSDLRDESLPAVFDFLKRNFKSELYEILREQYTVGKYDKEYDVLQNFNIKNIVTFNIDNLIEEIFSTATSEKYVYDAQVTGKVESPGISLFKIHGSVTYPASTEMLFTSEEVSSMYIDTPGYFSAIAYKFNSFPGIIWGANLDDANAQHIFSKPLLKSMTPSHKWIVIQEETKYNGKAKIYEARGFKIIRSNTKDFLHYLSGIKLSAKDVPAGARLSQMFDRNQMAQIKTQKHAVRPISLFYQGADPSWSDILSGTLHKLGSFDVVLNKMEKSPRCLILGSVGCGKTTLLMQLAAGIRDAERAFYFHSVLPEEAKKIETLLEDGRQALVFLDNLADNLEAFLVLSRIKNVRIVASERSDAYESIRQIARFTEADVIEIPSLEPYEIEKICKAMGRPSISFAKESVSLLEISYRLFTGALIQEKIKRLIGELKKDPIVFEIYIMLTYTRYCRVFTTMDTLFSYFSDDNWFGISELYGKMKKLRGLVDERTDVGDGDQDYYSLRSIAFAEISWGLIPKERFQEFLLKFAAKVSISQINRYDIFRRKAYDADITSVVFHKSEQGKEFYNLALRKHEGDRYVTAYVLQQFALYMKRIGEIEQAWDLIDSSFTMTAGRNYSISNTHAIILFEMNIATIEIEKIASYKMIVSSFETLEKCLQGDNRKTYHVEVYSRHALELAKHIHNDKVREYIERADELLAQEINTSEYLSRTTRRKLELTKKRVEHERQNWHSEYKRL